MPSIVKPAVPARPAKPVKPAAPAPRVAVPSAAPRQRSAKPSSTPRQAGQVPAVPKTLLDRMRLNDAEMRDEDWPTHDQDREADDREWSWEPETAYPDEPVPAQHAMRASATGSALGLFGGQFQHVDENVPPGSAFPAWLWQAFEKPGHILIEWHLDGRLGNIDWARDALAFDRIHHEDVFPSISQAGSVLVRAPRTRGMPWPEQADRILLAPATYRKASFKPWTREGQPEKPAVDTVELDPTKLAHWIRAPKAVIYGRCGVQPKALREPLDFWVVLPWKQIQAAAAGMTPGERSVLGLPGVMPEVDRRTGETKLPVPPAQRYFGLYADTPVFLQALRQFRQCTSLDSQPAGPGRDAELMRARLGELAADWPTEDFEDLARALGAKAGDEVESRAVLPAQRPGQRAA